MIRETLVHICTTAESILKATPSAGEVRQVILETFSSLSSLGPDNITPTAGRDVALTAKLLGNLQWLTYVPAYQSDSVVDSGLAVRACEWREGLPAGGVLDGGKFAAGSGLFLDILDGQGASGDRLFALDAAERLLRHVEFKRQLALAQSFPDLQPNRLMTERCDVAILFARAAVRHCDLRFLNAALKMNDWSLKRYGRRQRSLSVEQRARFMLSLAEQEFAAGALL